MFPPLSFPEGRPLYLKCPDTSADGVQLELQGAVASLNPHLCPPCMPLTNLVSKSASLVDCNLRTQGSHQGSSPISCTSIVPKANCYLLKHLG